MKEREIAAPRLGTTRPGGRVAVALLGLLLAARAGPGQTMAGERSPAADPGAASASAGAVRLLTVSAAVVAENEERSDQAADYFAKRIGLGRGFQARRVGKCPWNQVPRGCAADGHVNVVRLKFGDRLELLALMLDGNGAVAMAARAPALFQPELNFPDTQSPGDNQWPGNAPGDLVAQFAGAIQRGAPSKGAYQLLLQEWKEDEPSGGGETPMGESSSKGGIAERIYPLAAAAMYADNYRACTRPQEDVIALKVRMNEMGNCAVRASLWQGKKKIREIQRHDIHHQWLYDGLRALFLNLIEWQETVADFFRPDSGFQPLLVMKVDNPQNLLAPQKTILLGKQKDGFVALEAAGGDRLWAAPFDAKGGWGAFRDGQLFLGNGSRLTRIAAANAKAEFSIVTKNLAQMSVRGDLCADALYRQVRLMKNGKEMWTRSLPWSVEAGPLLTDRGVVLGDASGELRCFSLEGRELWKLALPRRVRGDIYFEEGLLFTADDRGMMYVVDQQGKWAWQADLGDVMTGAPQVIGTAVVVGAKSARLFSFDKNTGKALRSCQFTSWLLGCRVVGSEVVCMTLDKWLRILDAASFDQKKALRFPFQLNPDVLPVKDFPHRRPLRNNDVAEKATGFLVSDEKGNVYLVSTASRP